MANGGPRKCSGCGYKIKGGDHSFGRWGPNCSGPPQDDASGGEEESDKANSKDAISGPLLQKLLDKVEKLESAMNTGSNGKKSGTSKKKNKNTNTNKVVEIPSDSEDEDPINIDNMTTAQLKTFARNLNKERTNLKMAAQKPESVFQDKPQNRARSASISSLFGETANDGSAQSELRRAAESLKSRNKDVEQPGSNRIKDASVINDLRKDPRLRSTVDQFMLDIGDKAAWFQRSQTRDGDRTFPRDTLRRDPRDHADHRRDVRGGHEWDNGSDTLDDYDHDRSARDSNLLSRYRGNFRGQKELDEYLVRNTLSANTVSYAGVALQKTKELSHSNCNVAQYGVGAFFFLKNALIDKTITSKTELFNILSHYEHVFTCTANGTFSTNELSSRAFRVALQYDHKVSSSIDSGVTSWARLGQNLHAEYMLQAKDIVEAKERKNNFDKTGMHGAQGRNKSGKPGNEKIITICGDYNNKENETGKCTFAVTNNVNCRYEHSCRFCWNTKKQLFNHRELDCKSKSGEPFLDNGQN